MKMIIIMLMTLVMYGDDMWIFWCFLRCTFYCILHHPTQ